MREWRACQLEIEQTVLGSRDIFRQEEKGVSGDQVIDGGETAITNILLLLVSVLANLLLVRALIRGNEPVPRSAMYQFRQSGHQRRQPERRTGGRAGRGRTGNPFPSLTIAVPDSPLSRSWKTP